MTRTGTSQLQKKTSSIDKFVGIKVKNLSSGWLCEHVILTTTNNQDDSINSLIISGFQALEMDYFSIDTVVNSEERFFSRYQFLGHSKAVK